MENLFSGSIFFAILAYIGYQLKTLPFVIIDQIKKQFICSVHIEETSELFFYFEKWLAKFYSEKFKNIDAVLSGESKIKINENERYEKSDDDDNDIINKNSINSLFYRHYSDTFILKYKNKRLMITKGRDKLENANSVRNIFYNHFTVMGWLAKARITELLEEVIIYNKSLIKKEQFIYINSSYGDWNRFGIIRGKDIDSIFLKNKNQILEDMKKFLQKESWYIERGLNYRRGYLLYGSPGNGKTSLCLALAKNYDKDVYFLNLNDLEKDNNLFQTFRNIKDNSILILEDIDASFGNRNGDKNISFSALLNCIDGAFSKHGIIIIMTTNHPEKLDFALLREGRIDFQLEIDNPSKDIVEKYLSFFYGKNIILDNVYDNLFSMSKIQEICLRNKNFISGMFKIAT
jgi:hypothetical protein